jgi:hypothetical protein
MKKSELRKIIKETVAEQMMGMGPLPSLGGNALMGKSMGRLNVSPVQGRPNVSPVGGGGVTHTMLQVVKWIDRQPKKDKPNLWDRIKHLPGALWNNCGGAAGGCPMPH